jgi:DNA-binding NtrC family response regulator
MPYPKILIVDDQEGIRESLKLILGQDYNLILTESGIQALSCLEHDPTIQLVLIDIKMPGLNGLETLKKMKEMRPDIKVIIVTGYNSVETVTEASQLGACGYIGKPFQPQEVKEIVKKQIKI